MSEKDKKLLLEMKHNCLKDNGTTNETYNDYKRIMKAKAIDNVLEEIERLTNIINKLEIDIEIGTGKYEYDTDYNRGLSDAFIYMSERLQELKTNKEFVSINNPTLTTSSTSGNRRNWNKKQTRSSDIE